MKKKKLIFLKKKDDAVTLEISAKGKKAIRLKDKKDIEQDIVHIDKSAGYLPAYSGMCDADRAIASSLEKCSKEEQKIYVGGIDYASNLCGAY